MFAGDAGGGFRALDAKTGDVRWQTAITRRDLRHTHQLRRRWQAVRGRRDRSVARVRWSRPNDTGNSGRCRARAACLRAELTHCGSARARRWLVNAGARRGRRDGRDPDVLQRAATAAGALRTFALHASPQRHCGPHAQARAVAVWHPHVQLDPAQAVQPHGLLVCSFMTRLLSVGFEVRAQSTGGSVGSLERRG